MTVKDVLYEVAGKKYDASGKRLQRLIDIRAPQIMIDAIKDNLSMGKEKYTEMYVSGINLKKCPSDILQYGVISHETKTGNGGKQFENIITDKGIFNYFPNAKYGMILLPNKK